MTIELDPDVTVTAQDLRAPGPLPHATRENRDRRPGIAGARLALAPRMHRSIALVLLTACAGSTANEKPGPRGLRADQHLAIARREAEHADQLTRWPDTRPGLPHTGEDHLAGAWVGMWDTTAEHDRLAQIHRTAAAQLEAEYQEACGDTPAAIASVSPLQRYGIGGNPVEGGTLVLLSPEAGPPDALLSAMRCHRAWMMLGRTDMDDCPLDLPGLRVSARGDANGVALTITVADPALVPELRRRAALDLEAAQRRRRADAAPTRDQ